MKFVVFAFFAFFVFLPQGMAIDPSPDFATPDKYRIPCSMNYDSCTGVNKIDLGSAYIFYDCGDECSPTAHYGKADAYHDGDQTTDVANCGWGYDAYSAASSSNSDIYIYLKNAGWYSDLPANISHRVQTSLTWKMYYSSNCTGTAVDSGGDTEYRNNFSNTYVQCEGERKNSCDPNDNWSDPSTGLNCPAIDTLLQKPYYTGVVSYRYVVQSRLYHSGNSGTYYYAQDIGCFTTEWFD